MNDVEIIRPKVVVGGGSNHMSYLLQLDKGRINPHVASISPRYRGKNGSLLSIGQKGRFLHGWEMQKIK